MYSFLSAMLINLYTWCLHYVLYIGVKAIRNPTPACMRNYISGGDRSTWKSMKQTEHLLCLEKW